MMAVTQWARGAWPRLQRRASTFLYLLAHQTSGLDARAHLIPWILLGWIVANACAAPVVAILGHRLLGSPVPPLQKSW